MTNGPGILHKQGMVPIDGGHHFAGGILQDGGEIRIGHVAIFTGAGAPLVCQGSRRRTVSAVATTESRGCPVTNPWRGPHLHLRYIPMLIDHVRQVVELITRFDVVSSQPAALEEGDVLIKLIV